MSRPSGHAHINVLRPANFLEIDFFEKNIFQEHFQNVKWFGSRMLVLILVLSVGTLF